MHCPLARFIYVRLPHFGFRRSRPTHSNRILTFRCGDKKRGTQVRRGPGFALRWECHVQRSRCSLCRHARRVSRHNASGPSSTRSCEPWARQPGMGFFIRRR